MAGRLNNMDTRKIKEDLLLMDIEEDVVDEVVDKLLKSGETRGEKKDKQILIGEWEAQKKVEVNWKKKAILASKIVRINIE
jgi:hypothetical protein